MTDERNIQKIAADQVDDYITGCLPDYNYFKKALKTIAIDLNKQWALDANPKAIQQTNFTGNLRGNKNKLIFFIIEEAKEAILELSNETVKAF